MQLLLEVVGPKAKALGANARKVIGLTGARIGSGPDNEWVIVDDYVSRHHATIRVLGGMYYIEAKGRNPTAINDRIHPLARDDAQPLRDGDRLFIDEIEIAVRFIDSGATPAEPERRAEPGPRPEARKDWPSVLDDLMAGGPTSSVDPLALIGGGSVPVPAPQRPVPRQVAPIDRLVEQPVLPLSPGGYPEDDPFKTRMPKVEPVLRPQPQPQAPAAPLRTEREPASSGLSIDDLLRSAGFDPRVHQLSAGVAQELGAILRIVVEGTMEVLQARNDIKNEFRLPATRIAATNNNPLKFSANAEDALHDLLVKRGGAYLGAEASFTEAFEEIRFHQAAMLKGMEAGFRRVLEYFDPEKLAMEFEKHGARGGALAALGSRKARLWDDYLDAYRMLSADEDETFRRLFGDAFARAYEEHLRRLTTAQRNTRRDSGAPR
jgi:type VI secretion system protein ImpI